MNIQELAKLARDYAGTLDDVKIKLAPTEFGWYPYGTLENFVHLSHLLSGDHHDLLALAGDAPIVDIGAADGDTAFFLESLGYQAHAVDYPPTNFNGCRGLRLLRDALGSSVKLHEVDLDARFDLPGERYGLAFFLGILYHLKNPFNALESLARSARHAVISTRITRFNLSPEGTGHAGVNDNRVELRSVPCAYLVDPLETNNDPTNYWIFSEAGLRRILNRTGWDILDFMSVGNVNTSDPATSEGDERAFCLLRSRHAD